MGRERDGIALVTVSGLLVGFALLASLFVRGVRFALPVSEARAAAARTRLAAESGLDYAEARLFRESGFSKGGATPAGRVDDWTFREGFTAPLSGAWNPSYSHGEAWMDDGDGVREPGEAALADLDGDGRFSAWSGRLRGGPPFGPAFSLKIVSAGGKFPVNAGVLGTSSVYPGLKLSDNWSDVYSNRGLVRGLNSLGAVLFEEGEIPERFDAAAAGERIRISRLGRHLIGKRPLEGYRSLRQVRETLLARGYPASASERILEHLNLGPYDALDGYRQYEFYVGDSLREVRAVPVELATAPSAVLQALWLYQGGLWSAQVDAFETLKQVDFPRARGTLFYKSPPTGNPGTDKLMIYPDEARRLADWVMDFRKGPLQGNWLAFRRGLVAAAHDASWDLFRTERVPLQADPAAALAWVRAKADLAFYIVSPERPGPRDAATGWCGWGISHGAQPIGQPVLPFWGVFSEGSGALTVMGETPLVEYVPEPGTSGSYADPTRPYRDTGTGLSTSGDYYPVLATLGPATVYEVASLGGLAATGPILAEGTIRTADRVEFTTQEDFENLAGGLHLWERRRVFPQDPAPAARRSGFLDSCTSYTVGGTGGTYDAPGFPGLVTLPQWNVRWLPLGQPDYDIYAGTSGAIALANRMGGNQGAAQYASFTEWQGNPGQELISTPQPAGGVPFERPRLLADTDYLTPHCLYSEAVSLTSDDAYTWFDLPGITDAPDFPALSFELWCAPTTREETVGGERRFVLQAYGQGSMGTAQNAGSIWLSARAARDANGRDGINYRLHWHWESVESWTDSGGGEPGLDFGMGGAPPTWTVDFNTFVPQVDAATGRTLSDMNHVVVTFDCAQATACLYVNGLLRGKKLVADIPATRMVGMGGMLGGKLLMKFQGDEVRLYPELLSDADVANRYGLGRFVVPRVNDIPFFDSPLYVLERPARIGGVGWTGIPEGAPVDAAGGSLDRVGIQVWVHGYSDAGGNALAPGYPVLVEAEPGGVVLPKSLDGAGEVASFRYRVEFVNATGDTVTPLYQTPYFEGIWFTLKGAGRSPKRYGAAE